MPAESARGKCLGKVHRKKAPEKKISAPENSAGESVMRKMPGESARGKCPGKNAWEKHCRGNKVPGEKSFLGKKFPGKKVPGKKTAWQIKFVGKKCPWESAQGKKCQAKTLPGK